VLSGSDIRRQLCCGKESASADPAASESLQSMEFIIHRFESVTSTNDVAARLADEGAPEGTVVVAREQTAGKGRHGRSWSSPAGEGLYLSLVLRPEVPFERVCELAFVTSVAAADAVKLVSGLPARIKWPNDVLLGDRKVCGILIEARRQSAVCGLQSVVVGIGMNVNNQEFPPEISQTATSIALERGGSASLEEAEEKLLSCLGAWYGKYLREGFAPILREWRILDCTAGREVAVNTADGVVEGRAVEVDERGDLIVEREDGARTCIAAGEVNLYDA